MAIYKYLFIALLLSDAFAPTMGSKQNEAKWIAYAALPDLMFSDSQLVDAVANSTVYICKSTGAKRYHLKENCHGLSRCTHVIESTTIKKAEAKGLTLCKFED